MYNSCGDNMNGILLVNKPKGYTSHDVINVLRGILKTRKLGHTGTLDPDATGILVVGVNRGTKIMKFLNNDEKEYQATVLIGKSTDTQDKTGTIIEEKEVKMLENVDEIVKSFLGTYTQTPPMYSAVRYKGKKLYEYARQGIIINDIESRDIEIFSIKRTNEVKYIDDYASFQYSVHSSKGLYVRTLSQDIGKKLGYPAHNLELHRTKAGIFDVKDSYTLEDIKDSNYKLISLSNALSSFSKLLINDEIKKYVKNGMPIPLKHFKNHSITRIVDKDDNLLAIYDLHQTEPKMKALNILAEMED